MADQQEAIKIQKPKFKANDPILLVLGQKKYPGKVLRVDSGYYEDGAARYTVRVVTGDDEETTNWYREEYLERGDLSRLPKKLRDFQAIAPAQPKEEPKAPDKIEAGRMTVEDLVSQGLPKDEAERLIKLQEEVLKKKSGK